ncbi:MAG: DUF433 domain-containing protein [Euryarchaeota archaeon]|jgi:uncharacterized protein (DUF433 family)|nr:DUF433 domain-containing protein [Euryarchaeota archaeon]
MERIVETSEVLGGKPRIAGRRISVLQIKDWTDSGRSPTRIAADYDLDLADVHAALTYYCDRPEEMSEWRATKLRSNESYRSAKSPGLRTDRTTSIPIGIPYRPDNSSYSV